jgi:TolA-binding protein
MKAARAVLDYAFVKFPVLDGPDEQHYCAQVIAQHTRHGGQTAEQLAARVKELERQLRQYQADVVDAESYQRLQARVAELKEHLAAALAELEKVNRECRSYQRNLADAQADIAGEVEHSKELATRVTELESLASRLKDQRDTPAKPCWWLCFNPYPEGEKPTVYHPTLAAAKYEAVRLAINMDQDIHVLRIVGTARPPKAARWEER